MAADSYSVRAYEWAAAAIDSPAVNRLVSLAAQRYVEMLERCATSDTLRYSPDAVDKVCTFAERLPHIKGEWAGRSIVLEDWQVWVLSAIFGFQVIREGEWVRLVREVYAELPRKNGKSTLAAIIGLYMLVADDEPGAEVYAGATSKDQAFEVFRPARLMALKCPGFTDYHGVFVGKQSLSVEDTSSKFDPVIGKPGDGSSPHCAIHDEFHEHLSSDQYDTMQTGMGSRRQPLQAVITTAGINTIGPCYRRRDEAVKVLEGIVEEETLFAAIWTIDEDDDWVDFACWVKANPNYGVSSKAAFLQQQHRIALASPGRRNAILTKHLNLWQSAQQAWLDMNAWRRCGDSLLRLEDFRGEPCYLAVDLASKVDLAAAVALFERDGKVYAFLRAWSPAETIARAENQHYRQWRDEGYLVETPGAVIDFDLIEEWLLGLSSDYEVREIVYDPWHATQFATHLIDRGATMVELRNTLQNMSEPMKELEARVLSGRFVHDGNPLYAWMAANVVAREDTRGNVQPNKAFAENKIDGIVATIMGLNRLLSGSTPAYEGGLEWV